MTDISDVYLKQTLRDIHQKLLKRWILTDGMTLHPNMFLVYQIDSRRECDNFYAETWILLFGSVCAVDFYSLNICWVKIEFILSS
jgi:hypothetical protein